MAPSRPRSRDDFEVAIICALQLEYDAVCYTFDEFLDEDGDQFGKADGDTNHYTTGRIGKRYVVLALLPHMGKVNAAGAAAGLRFSFPGLRLALLVGVCGGLPFDRQDKDAEILLGDVIISKSVCQYDFGRKYPGKFEIKKTVNDSLGRPNNELQSLINFLGSARGDDVLSRHCDNFMQEIQTKVATQDKLYKSNYSHKHRGKSSSTCPNCSASPPTLCQEALHSLCKDLGCNDRRLVTRKRLQSGEKSDLRNSNATPPVHLHVGTVASGDMVLKSASDRDRIAKETNAIAFEMEGAGVWDQIPCIVVKGVCDYADSHKAKGWQDFAAARAASTAKGIVQVYAQTDRKQGELTGKMATTQPPKAFSTVPFSPDPNYIDRKKIMSWLGEKMAQANSRAALVGLGGVGKSQIAIQFAHRFRQASEDAYVFWVYGGSKCRFEQAYKKIADKLNLPQRKDPKCNVLQLVHDWLCDEKNGPWLMILDNADSADVFFPNEGTANKSNSKDKPLSSYLPRIGRGAIVITSRSKNVATRLAGSPNLHQMSGMTKLQAFKLLQTGLGQECNRRDESIIALLKALDNLPLAISQAAAYIRRNTPRMTVPKYLSILQNNDTRVVDILNKEMPDLRRDDSASYSVITTWEITFDQIRREKRSAADLLSFMCFLDTQGIPEYLLTAYSNKHRKDNKSSLEDDIEVLRDYSLISTSTQGDMFKMHPLVQTCTRAWIKSGPDKPGRDEEEWAHIVLSIVLKEYPDPRKPQNWVDCQRMDPHVNAVIKTEPKRRAYFLQRHRMLYELGIYRRYAGDYKAGEEIFRRSLEANEKVLGWDHGGTLITAAELGIALHNQEKFSEAEALHRKILKFRQKVSGPKHPETIKCMIYLGSALIEQQKLEEGKEIYNQCLEVVKQSPELENDLVLTLMNNFAELVRKTGSPEAAEKIHRECLKMMQERLGPKHLDTLSSMRNLAVTLAELGKLSEAEKLLRQRLEVSEKVLTRGHPETLDSTTDLAWILGELSRLQEACFLYERACSGYTQRFGADHPKSKRSAESLSRLKEEMSQESERYLIS
ncbi:hypothetical protein FSARC_14214 [Fusarium sarcochroum]|uniref:Nucleoside phosphorylase domain-containing protein n=1 Tax=Fusarium sarcochroum TaxID=1208366 RepID=A0A8H4WPT8_9HYPO|nr:hypothetical protein FSARC_14214 [Fusarium sarcochroum]